MVWYLEIEHTTKSKEFDLVNVSGVLAYPSLDSR